MEVNDYKNLWSTLKKFLKNCYEDTDPDKEVNESIIYLDLLEYMKLLEIGDIDE